MNQQDYNEWSRLKPETLVGQRIKDVKYSDGYIYIRTDAGETLQIAHDHLFDGAGNRTDIDETKDSWKHV